MIKTSTPELEFTATPTKEKAPKRPVSDEPSAQVLLNILNFSKNLEVLPVTVIGAALVLKS